MLRPDANGCIKAAAQAAGLFGCDCQCAACCEFYAPADAFARALNDALDELARTVPTNPGATATPKETRDET